MISSSNFLVAVTAVLMLICIEISRAKICMGGDSCCTPRNLCYVNEGDCDTDADCLPGLVCSPNSCVGDTFDGFPFPDDCCQFPARPTYGIRGRKHRFRAAYGGGNMDYIGQQQQEMAAMQYGG